MCGIFGLAAKEPKNSYTSNVRKEIFYNGMLFNIMRGWDGTGFATVREVLHQGKYAISSSVVKRSIHAVDFFCTKTALRGVEEFNQNHFVIGHTRSSTKGANNDSNAHPFRYGNIILVHNGTVDTSTLPVKAEEVVDSASIAATMDKEGEKKTLELLDGAYSLVWYNQKDDSLNFARNKRKPMAIAFTDKGDMYFSSEWATLYNVLMRNGQTIESMQIPRPMVHYKFFKEDLQNYEKTTFKEYSRPIAPHTTIWPTGGASGTQPTAGLLTTSKDISNGGSNNNLETPPPDLKMTTEKHAQLNALLIGDHLKIGQILPFVPVSFETYSKAADRGVLRGNLFARKSIKVVLYQINEAVWKTIKKQGTDSETGAFRTIAVRIINARSLGGGKIEIICDLQTTWSKRLLQATEGELGENEISVEKIFFGPSKGRLSKRDFADRVKHGCGECCGIVIGDGDDPLGKDILWVGESPLCSDCQANDEVMTKLGLLAEGVIELKAASFKDDDDEEEDPTQTRTH